MSESIKQYLASMGIDSLEIAPTSPDDEVANLWASEAPRAEGVKFDTGKPDLSLVPLGLVEGCARAMMFGVGKYGRDNWRSGFDDSRLLAACLRHIMAYTNGERIDAESGLCHLDCASFSLGVVLDQIRRREMGQDAGSDDLPGKVQR